MRCFTALPVPAETALLLAQLEIPGAAKTLPEDYHLTLRFLGEITDTQRDLLLNKVLVFNGPPLIVELEGSLGAIAHEGEGVIFAYVKINANLLALQKYHENVAQSIGLKAASGSYLPHITLARYDLTKSIDLEEVNRRYAGMALPPFRIEKAGIFMSHSNRPDGRRYVQLL